MVQKVEINPITGQLDLIGIEQVNWGEIQGDISNQTDLIALLNNTIDKFIVVDSITKLPTPVGNVITIDTKTTLFFPNEIDLQGNRLNFSQNCTILGTSSETSKITSTLPDGEYLITSNGSLAIQNISVEVLPSTIGDVVSCFDLNGNTQPGAALDWTGVNVVSGVIGIIKNYANAIFKMCGFIGTTDGFVFTNTFDSIVFDSCIFRNTVAGTCLKITAGGQINRRIRIENTPFVVTPGQIGIDISEYAIIGVEGYIVKFVNFSGGGTYLQGVQPNDNKALFIECRGVQNSASITEYYMINNTTATTISATNTYTKIEGVTSNGAYIQRFTNTDNRSTYDGALTKFFKVDTVASLSSGNNHLIGLRIAKNGITIPSSENQMTTSASGRSDNIKSQTIVELSTDDYIEVFVCNQSASTDITVSELNTIITPLN
jgi:hypothetical protein